MPFKTIRELDDQFGSDAIFKDRILKCFAMRELYRNSVRHPSFKPSEELLAAIELSEAGETMRNAAIEKFHASPESAKFAVFILFYHHDLFIDIEKTKVARIVDALTNDILSKRPVIFGYSTIFSTTALMNAFLNGQENCRYSRLKCCSQDPPKVSFRLVILLSVRTEFLSLRKFVGLRHIYRYHFTTAKTRCAVICT